MKSLIEEYFRVYETKLDLARAANLPEKRIGVITERDSRLRSSRHYLDRREPEEGIFHGFIEKERRRFKDPRSISPRREKVEEFLLSNLPDLAIFYPVYRYLLERRFPEEEKEFSYTPFCDIRMGKRTNYQRLERIANEFLVEGPVDDEVFEGLHSTARSHLGLIAKGMSDVHRYQKDQLRSQAQVLFSFPEVFLDQRALPIMLEYARVDPPNEGASHFPIYRSPFREYIDDHIGGEKVGPIKAEIGLGHLLSLRSWVYRNELWETVNDPEVMSFVYGSIADVLNEFAQQGYRDSTFGLRKELVERSLRHKAEHPKDQQLPHQKITFNAQETRKLREYCLGRRRERDGHYTERSMTLFLEKLEGTIL